MGRRRYEWIAGGVLLYCGLAVAFLVRLPIIERGIELLPSWMVAFALAVVGPAVLFAAGIDAWRPAAIVMILVVSCLALARVAWRNSPETEGFAGWLICAGVIWVGSTWLLMAMAAI